VVTNRIHSTSVARYTWCRK